MLNEFQHLKAVTHRPQPEELVIELVKKTAKQTRKALATAFYFARK